MKNIITFLAAILLLADSSCKKDTDTSVAEDPAVQVSKAKQTLISNSPYLLTEVRNDNYLNSSNQLNDHESAYPDKSGIQFKISFNDSNKILMEKQENGKTTGKMICFWDIREKQPASIRMGHYINQVYTGIRNIDYTFSGSTPDVNYTIKPGSIVLKGTLYSAPGADQIRHEVTYILKSANR